MPQKNSDIYVLPWVFKRGFTVRKLGNINFFKYMNGKLKSRVEIRAIRDKKEIW